MPIDRIPPSSSLIETMRAMARDRAGGTQRGSTPPAVGSSIGETAAPATAHRIGELRLRLRGLAAAVDLKDPTSLAGVRTPALREILLWEFGRDFRKDSQFSPMVDAISGAMDADPHLQQRFVQLIAELQKT